MKILSLIFLLISTTLLADISDKQKINILTDYLVKEEHKNIKEARSEAIASIYGKPIFSQLSYDDDTEMFFGRIKSSKASASKLVNFYMPRKRAISFKNNPDLARIEVEHIFRDNSVVLKDIELDYQGVKYPMAIKRDTRMSLKIGGYFVANQDTTLYAKKNGVGGSVDLQELFDLEETTQAIRAELAYEFNKKHKIEASYYTIKNSSTKDVSPFEFNGETVSGNIDISFDTDIYKMTYIYSAYRTNTFELTTRIGMHITEFSTKLNSVKTVNGITTATNIADFNLPAPLPVFGLGFNYDITNDLSLKYHVDYFYISVGVDGTMVDTQIELDYMINDYAGLALGVNTTKMDFNTQIDETTFGLNHDVAGFIFSVIFRY